jgi:hypothetical protein
MEDYGEECKKTHDLGKWLVATEAVLQGTKDALARVKQQLVDSDSMVVGNYLSFCCKLVPLHQIHFIAETLTLNPIDLIRFSWNVLP